MAALAALGVLAALGADLPARALLPSTGASVAEGSASSDGSPTAPVALAAFPRTEMLYAVSAHPDDEPAAWWLIENRPRAYAVFVLMTQGEQTDFCMSADEVPPDRRTGDPGLGTFEAPSAEPPTGEPPTEDEIAERAGELAEGDLQDDDDSANGTIAEGFLGYHLGNAGPWAYQGPDSPVGEPDKGERHPLGNPWQGQGTQACKDARVAAWHWFLDAMATHDPTMASMGVADDPYDADTYRGRFCGNGAKTLGCARVWATGDGARVVFDAGDQDLSSDEVITGLELVRQQRARWGLPAALPEGGIVAAVPGPPPGCREHVDHAEIRDVLYGHDFGAGPQWGVSCDPSDPRFLDSPAPPMPFDPIDLRMNKVDPHTEQRQGTYNVNYGWLYDTYVFSGSTGMAWRRFG